MRALVGNIAGLIGIAKSISRRSGVVSESAVCGMKLTAGESAT